MARSRLYSSAMVARKKTTMARANITIVASGVLVFGDKISE